MNEKWISRFMNLAEHVADWSKDPSTKVGAVLVSPDRSQVVHGYNGFPRGVKDNKTLLEDKEKKYKRIVHAELNAILNCPVRPEGWSLFIHPLPPCTECTKAIIQSGVGVIVFPVPEEGSKWTTEFETSEEMLREAGVRIVRVRYEEQGNKVVKATGCGGCGKSCRSRNS